MLNKYFFGIITIQLLIVLNILCCLNLLCTCLFFENEIEILFNFIVQAFFSSMILYFYVLNEKTILLKFEVIKNKTKLVRHLRKIRKTNNKYLKEIAYGNNKNLKKIEFIDDYKVFENLCLNYICSYQKLFSSDDWFKSGNKYDSKKEEFRLW